MYKGDYLSVETRRSEYARTIRRRVGGIVVLIELLGGYTFWSCFYQFADDTAWWLQTDYYEQPSDAVREALTVARQMESDRVHVPVAFL